MYACAFALMFGMSRSSSPQWYIATFAHLYFSAAAELGLVSDLLHEGGNSDTNYPSKEYKHDLGLLLFTCIVSLLYIIAHSFISMGSKCNNFFLENQGTDVFRQWTSSSTLLWPSFGVPALVSFSMSRLSSRTPVTNRPQISARNGRLMQITVLVSSLCKVLHGLCVRLHLSLFVSAFANSLVFVGVLCIIMMFGMLFHLVEFKTRNNVSMYRVWSNHPNLHGLYNNLQTNLLQNLLCSLLYSTFGRGWDRFTNLMPSMFIMF